ncbi:hypothetical protein BU25DRAFT_443636 [Macroventuria anomochaeta]|uniref:Uncharacterized protein n=1 Tax=Macroventuria anomochaeta TaxID=301207 RepID=A0ACB6RJW2_9PLEO|nr:uncharacterized protein BU25DRAFT_443636 [Macroventuria anomochaeta]KAF2621685.1 hypothetical protein BU25DRAFT_443636 [Macroventuria anomochaeta]
MEPASATSLERPLRLLTYLATAITIPLNIAATILSLEKQRHRWARRHVTAYCFVFIPLALTVAASSMSLQYMKKHGKSPRALHFKVLDLVSALAYIAVLIPCWVLEIREFNAGGFGLLTGYVTAPMILNLFIHTYFTLAHIPWKQCFSKVFTFSQKGSYQQCPNCQAAFTSGTTQTTTKKGYSLLRGEDYLDVEADPVQYRDSEDFLGEGAERAEQPEQAKAAEDSGKGKNMVEV